MLGVDTLEELKYVDEIMAKDTVYESYKNTASI
jgi:hypothetical protein